MVIGALERAFGAGAIVADDIDDERVVELALVLNFLNNAANLMVGVGYVSGEDLSLAGVEFLLDRLRASPTSAALRHHTRSARPAMG